MKRKLIAILVFGISLPLLPNQALAEELPNPQALIEQVVEKYTTLETFQAQGRVSSEMVQAEMTFHSETTFSLKLKKPNLYRITWTHADSMGSGKQQSAVWNAGKQPYLFMSVMNAYEMQADDEAALSAATGISNGLTFTIPNLFFDIFDPSSAVFSDLIQPQVKGIEKLDGTACYVLSGPSRMSRQETYWIDVEDYLIRQYQRNLEPPEGGYQFPDFSDEEWEAAAEGLTPEEREQHRETIRQAKAIIEQSRQSVEAMEMKGFVTQVYDLISTPTLRREDFQFTPPPDAILKQKMISSESVLEMQQQIEKMEAETQEQIRRTRQEMEDFEQQLEEARIEALSDIENKD